MPAAQPVPVTKGRKLGALAGPIRCGIEKRHRVGRPSGAPVVHGSASDRDRILETWLAAKPEGVACVIGDPTFQVTPRVRSLTPELVKGLEFDLVLLSDPETFGTGIEGAVERYVVMTPSDPAPRGPHELVS